LNTTNKVESINPTDYSDLKQHENEPLKDYLNCFYDIIGHIHSSNEEMFVDTFIKGLHANPLSESLNQTVKKFFKGGV